MSNSLQAHELQHIRLLCPSLSPRAGSNSYPLSWWCYLVISSSATLFSFCLPSFQTPGSFPVSWLFVSGGQRIGALATQENKICWLKPTIPQLEKKKNCATAHNFHGKLLMSHRCKIKMQGILAGRKYCAFTRNTKPCWTPDTLGYMRKMWIQSSWNGKSSKQMKIKSVIDSSVSKFYEINASRTFP